DWNQLRQLRDILSKFDEFTRLVSHTKPQLSLSIALYYELEELFQDASNREGLFKDADQVLYFGFVDEVNTYYIAMILDPRFKCELLKQELEDDVAASFLITQLRDFLHRHYPPENEPQSPSHLPPSNEANSSTELRLLQKLHAPSRNVSDIDRYFDDGIISVANNNANENWLFEWWTVWRSTPLIWSNGMDGWKWRSVHPFPSIPSVCCYVIHPSI
ncbi:hypothetical protein V1506DRAFT_457591, partial [Lipomyces tetrasporus]